MYRHKFFWNLRGSEWNRWDPHLHAPGTLLNDQFSGDWNKYLDHVEISQPTVRALGVTDYFCIETYKKVRRSKAEGRLPDVDLILPNIEMRLDIKTRSVKPINIHLIFSPEDPEHESHIERILSHLTFEYRGCKYNCTLQQLEHLGRAFDPEQTDRNGAIKVGAKQFKTSLPELRAQFRTESWLRKNCLVAVAGGKDGASGLQDDDSYAATRREIERFSNIIFSGTPSVRDYWLGKKPDFGPSFIEETYGYLKPCLHGSDAHQEDSVLAPDRNRYCWIKGDLSFETLRQAVIEPEERVWIGEKPPVKGNTLASVRCVSTVDAQWMGDESIELNSGLVAIIGARGSGKTALADIIASGAGAMTSEPGESSFLKRASHPKNHIGNARVKLTWNDRSECESGLLPPVSGDLERSAEAKACYLSQHFVERLCSSFGLATELRKEIERVVFAETEVTDRQETDSFDELASVLLDPIKRRRKDLDSTMEEIAKRIVEEEDLRDQLASLTREAEFAAGKVERFQKEKQSILRVDNQERAQALARVENACAKAEGELGKLKRRLRALEDLQRETSHRIRVKEPGRFREMRQTFSAADLSDSVWKKFQMKFSGDVDTVIEEARKHVSDEIRIVIKGEGESATDLADEPLDNWPLDLLREERERLRKKVGIDEQQNRRYADLQRTITDEEATLRRLQSKINKAGGAAERRQGLIESRRQSYSQIFDTLLEEERVLKNLYAPLGRALSQNTGALAKLEFVVRRRVDVAGWVSIGEELLDLRKDTSFRGHGALKQLTESSLLDSWTKGAADDVAAAMDDFRSNFEKDLIKARPASVLPEMRRTWAHKVAGWLFNTDHIRIEYGIHYEGIAIEHLSPGMRGIVLLLVYLAVDQTDQRPLIIDQPEENLDPNTVFEELVPHFREVRKRRQVIVVTHNANLVVNTDADQVIVASSSRQSEGPLPMIAYMSGSLENPEIRSAVCKILEGGERAFLERERRYRLRWYDDSPLEVSKAL